MAYEKTSALQLAVREQPKAILLDIGLHTISGYEIARQLRHHFR